MIRRAAAAVSLALAATSDARAQDGFGEAFDEVHRLVAERFLDPELGGLDWEALGRAHRPRAVAAGDLDAFGEVVNELLAHLGTSHTRFYTAREPAYYQLLAIFRGPLAEEIRAAHPEDPTLAYPGVGILTTRVGEETFVRGVLEGWPAAAAGVRAGDRIVAVDGERFHPLASFEGKVGRATLVTVQRAGPDARPLELAVVPVAIDPAELFLRAMRESVRVHERGGKRIGYVHAWSLAGAEHAELLRDVLAGRLRDADALVLDLRDGWGGGNPEDVSLFDARVPAMTHVLRDGTRREVDPVWRKPVALLVDGGSRSGKEVLAYAFKEHALGPVVGERTAGAVVGGQPFLVQRGMLLYLAVLDVLVDGERLEGRGVEPDVPVPFDLRYAAGADPRLEAALDALAGRPAPR